MKRYISLLSLLLASLCLLSCAVRMQSQPNAGILRLHILAASDSMADQAVKLRVRDAILSIEGAGLSAVSSREEARALIESDAARIQQTAESVLADAGFAYGARMSMGIYPFPNRRYGGALYPAGDYLALRVVLGEGKGKNWWCVLFPPLCILEVKDGDIEYEEDGDVKWKSLLQEWMDKGDTTHEQAQ